jgi:hypothetical protein
MQSVTFVVNEPDEGSLWIHLAPTGWIRSMQFEGFHGFALVSSAHRIAVINGDTIVDFGQILSDLHNTICMEKKKGGRVNISEGNIMIALGNKLDLGDIGEYPEGHTWEALYGNRHDSMYLVSMSSDYKVDNTARITATMWG